MNFEEELDDLINKCIAIHGRDNWRDNWRDRVVSALELKLMALREQEPDED